MSESAATTAGATLLIIDDEAVVRDMLAAVLGRHGYGVLSAANGSEGVALYEERGAEIDLVLLDLSMPDMSGVEVLHKLRALDPQVQVALLTGYADEDPALAGLELVFKPFLIDELLELVARLVR